MARGGYRPGSGRKKKLKINDRAKKPINDVISGDSKKKEEPGNLTPLKFMLKVMNDPNEDKDRRDRMAIAAAPYCHARGGEKGKKDEQKDRAGIASKGKFAPSRPPLRLVAAPRKQGIDDNEE